MAFFFFQLAILCTFFLAFALMKFPPAFELLLDRLHSSPDGILLFPFGNSMYIFSRLRLDEISSPSDCVVASSSLRPLSSSPFGVKNPSSWTESDLQRLFDCTCIRSPFE